ncbi:MAG: hypothetical protein M1165_01425 [Candidatus Pacearchaeota archaeon]|jgi:hypothetical protein|nr:hypothetical protein [Candidatus Pacearchaeota archaeon]
MRGYPGNSKKVILVILNLIFGLYFLNSQLSFFKSIGFLSSANGIMILAGGALFLIDFIYLLFFAKRIRLA